MRDKIGKVKKFGKCMQTVVVRVSNYDVDRDKHKTIRHIETIISPLGHVTHRYDILVFWFVRN